MTQPLLVLTFTVLGCATVAAQERSRDSARPAFATASVKPSTSGLKGPGAIRLQPGGGFSASNITVRELVEYAYQRHAFDRREVAAGPAWIDADRFDIVAKAPGEHSIDADASFRETWSMLQVLLADRFKLKLHEENRDRPVYLLMLATSDGTLGAKLRKTDIDCGAVMRGERPTLRPGQGPPCSLKTPPGRLFVNTAGMATIASLISRHVDRMVIDRTGLDGRFDMELEASDIEAAPDYKPGPSDLALPPAAGPSIFVAVREQLGLKLEPQIAAIPVLVIDQIERPSAGVESSRHSDVIYGRRFGLALTMEVFAPAKPNGLGVVWVVSSSGNSSREQTLQPSFERRILPLLKHGYTIFAAIHGSSPVFQVQDYVQDVRRAVRFVRHRAAEFGVDAQRLGIAGSSAGGLIALIVAMRGEDGNAASDDAVERVSSRVQAVGCFFAPTDLTNFGDSSQNIVDLLRQRGTADPSFQFYDVDGKSGARTVISDREHVLRMLREMSPVTHVTPEDPPTILLHGDADKAVPLQQSRRLIDRLNETGVAARLVVREGKGHAWPGWEAESELVAEWFDAHLRPGAAQ